MLLFFRKLAVLAKITRAVFSPPTNIILELVDEVRTENRNKLVNTTERLALELKGESLTAFEAYVVASSLLTYCIHAMSELDEANNVVIGGYTRAAAVLASVAAVDIVWKADYSKNFRKNYEARLEREAKDASR